ncbi:hypothetical protein [Leptospira ellisii]|uniref:hypothetical protein n=1 Tax=Leptospira ellisii TaxID=2023197 RepID=UPI000C2A9241|nr:hypothetical protein [Leptospira ellisii]PKA04553.1 hypothetical protein CH375_10255 [Leptospira ellisii]
MFRIDKAFGWLLLTGLLVNAGCKGEENNNDEVLILALSQLAAPTTSLPDLPQPASDSVLLIVDGTSEILLSKRDCNEPNGIIFDKQAMPPFEPVFNLHQVDFSKNSGVFIEAIDNSYYNP